MEKTIYLSYPLGREWYKVEQVEERPRGEANTHFSLRQYADWELMRFVSCSGRRFDEVTGSGNNS